MVKAHKLEVLNSLKFSTFGLLNDQKVERIGIIGLGYVGLPLAVELGKIKVGDRVALLGIG